MKPGVKKGNIPWNKGKVGVQTHSLETREKIRAGMIGKSSVWLVGRKQSEVSNAKRREALAGEKSYLWKDGRTKSPMYRSYIDANRRALKKGNGGSHTFDEWVELKEKYRNTCPCCWLSEPEIVLTRDHIVALVKGGTDDIANIQPLCKSCNSRKKIQTIRYPVPFLYD